MTAYFCPSDWSPPFHYELDHGGYTLYEDVSTYDVNKGHVTGKKPLVAVSCRKIGTDAYVLRESMYVLVAEGA